MTTENNAFEIKICGITTQEALEAAAAAGADAIGLVFAESPRQIGLGAARELARACPPDIACIAVFRHPAPDEVALVLDNIDIDAVQSDASDYDAIEPILVGTPFRAVYRDSPDLASHLADAAAQRIITPDDIILIEGPRSGSGTAPDWQRIAAATAGLVHPPRILLAGGLNADNIAEAVRAVRPAGVDTSSGVESFLGIKDAEKIRAFITAARAAYESLQTGSRP
jgi:phosphoribosylanthranilate isomerase